MTPSNLILVAHDRNALRQASKLAEILEPFAEVQLCSYELSREQLPQEPDALLCVVTDDESVELAHDFQGRLEDVPAFVVDSSGSLKIEPNGYAGRVSTSPEQVLGAVRQFLKINGKSAPAATRRERPQVSRRISTPFNHVLARSAGVGQAPQAILVASARQLASDLRAERVEVYQHVTETNSYQRIYTVPEICIAPHASPSVEVIRLIKRRLYPTTPDELQSRSFAPLQRYLANGRLNVLVPLARESRLLGWIAFRLEPERCTEDLLDDLQVAAHLLATSLAEAQRREDQGREAHHLKTALAALNSGIVVVNPAGQIACAAGALELLGSHPQTGDHFRSIHNSRVREVVALALNGDFVEKSWVDFESNETISSLSTRLPDGRIAAFWSPRPSSETAQKRGGLELKEVLRSLPVPVVLDGEASADAIPQAWITDEDGRAIRDCALQAQAKNVKALRLRWGREHSTENAVLFYETSRNEASEQFCDDIGSAVRFSLVAA